MKFRLKNLIITKFMASISWLYRLSISLFDILCLRVFDFLVIRLGLPDFLSSLIAGLLVSVPILILLRKMILGYF